MAEKDELISQYVDRPGVDADTAYLLQKLKTIEEALEKVKNISIRIDNTQSTKVFTAASKEAKTASDGLVKSQKEVNRALIEERLLNSQRTAALKNQIREEQALKGSLEQRRAALIRLNAVYDNLSPQQRSAAAGLRLQSILAGLSTQVKGLEATTGRNARNVGNYFEAFNRAIGPIRTLANILPGLGISGIFLLAYQGVVKLIEGIGTLIGVTSAAKRNQENFNTALTESKDAYAKASTEVAELTQEIEAAKKGFIDKDEVIKKYNSSIGETTGKVNTLDEAEQALVKNGQAYIQMTLFKAAAQFALGKAAEKAFDIEQTRRKKDAEFRNALLDAPVTNRGGGAGPLGGGIPASQAEIARLEAQAAKNQAARKAARLKEEEGEKKSLEDVAKKFFDDATAISKKYKFNYFKETFDSKETDNIKTAQRSFFADVLKEEEDNFRQIAQTESLALSTRLKAREDAKNKELEIIKGQRNAELLNEIDKLNAIKNQKGITDKEKLNATEISEAARTEIVKKANYLIEKAERDLVKDRIEIRAKGGKKEKDQLNADAQLFITDQQNKFAKEVGLVKDRMNERVAITTETYATEIKLLNDQYKKRIDAAAGKEKDIKKITEEYQRERAAMELGYAKSVLKAEIEAAEAIVKLRKQTGQDPKETIALEKTIAEAKIKLDNLETENFVKNTGKKKKITEAMIAATVKAIEQVKMLSDQLFDGIGKAIDASIIGEKNRLQAESDAIDIKTENEIAAIERSTVAEADKADQIAIINAKQAADKQRIAREERQLDIKKAQFDKAQSIMNIILNTAVAVTKNLGNPFLAAAIAALGAFQLGVALATPIPKYRMGVKGHPGGPAILGDGGRSEYVQLPSGEGFASASKDTVYDLPRGAHVYPDADKHLQTINKMAFSQKTYQGSPDKIIDAARFKALSEAYAKGSDKIVNTIKNKETIQVRGNHAGIVLIHKWAQNQTRYIDEQTL